MLRRLKDHWMPNKTVVLPEGDHIQPPQNLPRHILPFLPYVDRLQGSDSVETAAPFEPHPISLDTIKNWLSTCASAHGAQCLPSSMQSLFRPTWLIDVNRWCIVPTPECFVHYVTLSYVWGRKGGACVTTDTLDSFLRDGSLRLMDTPRVIRDAIELCALLGFQYLWVDRLCILQDDGPAKKYQLEGMAYIYAGSQLTIVAAQGKDSHEPLCPTLVVDDSDDTLSRFRSTDSDALFNDGSPSPEPIKTDNEDVWDYFANASDFIADERWPSPDSPVPDIFMEAPRSNAPEMENCEADSPTASFSPEPSSPLFLSPIHSPTKFARFAVDDKTGDGDPSSGISGWHFSPPEASAVFPERTTRRQFREKWEQLRRMSGRHQDIMEGFAVGLINSKWYSRGWTFQEALFARRKLVFHQDTVNWECHCASWHEAQQCLALKDGSPGAAEEKKKNKKKKKRHMPPSGAEQPPTLKSATEQQMLGNTPWPDLHRYSRLVALYNIRGLTFPEDAYDAFDGVLSVFGGAFAGGFVAGLPRVFFDAALLWQPYNPLERRRATATGRPVFPSWSWVGWQGNLHSESWKSGYDYLRRGVETGRGSKPKPPSSWRTISTVIWSASDEQGRRVTIQQFPSGPGQGTSIQTRDELPIPPGWSRHHCEATKRDYFTHESWAQQGFWYPVPAPAPGEGKTEHFRSLFLHGRTRICHSLQIGRLFRNYAASHCWCATLVDSAGHWAGVLRLNLPPGWTDEDARVGDKCTLIELSAGVVRNQEGEEDAFDEWLLDDCPRHTEQEYIFFNVMWIEQADGVVSRKSVGRVKETTWRELAAREEVDITLA